jgi:hypothetical protein
MLQTPDTRNRFFSVTHSTKIQGERYIPSVCYPLSSSLQTVIEEMAARDMARIYTEKVRFVTGVPYPVKKSEVATPRPVSVPPPEAKAGGAVKPSVKKPPSAPEKPGRKSGRNAFTAQTNREFE